MLNGKKAKLALIGIVIGSVFEPIVAQAQYVAPRTTVDNQSANSPYRFDFQVTGTNKARPVQVFTDGSQTFLQFPDGIKPSYAKFDGKKQRFHEASPYYVLYDSPNEFDVHTNKGEINIRAMNNENDAASLLPPKPKTMITSEALRERFDTPIEHQKIQSAMKVTTDEVTRARIAHEQQVQTLKAGGRLSDELRAYVKSNGWSNLKWKLDYDYKITAPIPMKGDMITAITNLVRTYQDQGGLMGVSPFFAAGNRTVVIQKMDLATPMPVTAK